MYFIWSILNRMIQGCDGKDRGEQKEIRIRYLVNVWE